MLEYLSSSTLKAIYADLLKEQDGLRLQVKAAGFSSSAQAEWNKIKTLASEVEKAYKNNTGEEII